MRRPPRRCDDRWGDEAIADYSPPRSCEPERIDIEGEAHAASRQRIDRTPPMRKKALHLASFAGLRQHLPALESRAARECCGNRRKDLDVDALFMRDVAARVACRGQERVDGIASRRLGDQQCEMRERRQRRRTTLSEQHFGEAVVVVTSESERKPESEPKTAAEASEPEAAASKDSFSRVPRCRFLVTSSPSDQRLQSPKAPSCNPKMPDHNSREHTPDVWRRLLK